MQARAIRMTAYATGDYVKVEFRDEQTGEAEWMWVRVEFSDDENRLVFGCLDSQPVVFANTMHQGLPLAVSYDNIREHVKAEDFIEK